MNVLAVVGTMAGKKSHTAQLCGRLYAQLDEEIFHGTATYECITLDQVKIDFCLSCNGCFAQGECVRRELDDLHILEDKMMAADIIMLGSPVYIGGISGVVKNLLDRLTVWGHEMRLAGRLIIPVLTASSNHLEDPRRSLERWALNLGGIMPASLGVYDDEGSPLLTNEAEMTEACHACAQKVAAALDNRTKFITRNQRLAYCELTGRHAKALQMKRMLGFCSSGEADEWDKTGLPQAGSLEKYCWEHYPHAAGEVCDEGESYFRPELAGWTGRRQHYQCLTSIVRAVESCICLLPFAEVLEPEAKQELAVAYARRLEIIMAFTLESRLTQHLAKKNFAALLAPQSVTEEEKLAASAELLAWLKENRGALWRQFPRLFKLVSLSREHFIAFVVEFLQAFTEHQLELEAKLFAHRRCSKILHVKCDAGDSHNHGRVTMLVQTDAGWCVYKPHDLSIDAHMHDFLAKHFDAVTGAPAAVCCGEVGFCEFIENTPAGNEAETKTYYHNLGGLIAVLYLLGATDFHEENMLVHGLKPLPIDLETIMNPEFVNEKILQEAGFARGLMTSVLKAGMGPMHIGPREISPLHDAEESNCSAPYWDGQRHTVTGYEDELLQGFRENYQYCLAHREEILADLQAMQHDKLRVVVRATQAYCILLFKTYQTGWLKQKDISDKVQQALANSRVLGHSVELEQLATAETEAICRGDVPYFCLEAGGHALLGEGRTVTENYCTLSALEAVEAHFRRMSPQDLEFQSDVLRAMCRKAVKTRAEETEDEPGQLPQLAPLSREQLVAEAEKLFAAICQDALHYTDGKPYWLGLEEKLRMAAAGLTGGLLGGESGLGIFFAALAKLTGRQEIREQAQELAGLQLEKLHWLLTDMENHLTDLQAKDKEMPPLDLGLNQGLAGTLAGFCLLGRYLDRTAEVLPECTRLLQVVQQYPWRKGDYGLADGFAGLLAVLCRYQELWQLPGAEPLAQRLVDELLARQTAEDRDVPDIRLWENSTLKWPLSGYSRGQAGIAAALTLAGEKLGRQDALEAAAQVLKFEDVLYLAEAGGWPRLTGSRYSQKPAYGLDGGTAGVGLALLQCRGELAARNLTRALQAVAQQGLLPSDSLTWGNAAAVELLLLAAKRTGEPSYTQRAQALLAAMAARATQQGGYHYLPAGYQLLFVPTFLDGAAGVGYELLRAAAPAEIESVF